MQSLTSRFIALRLVLTALIFAAFGLCTVHAETDPLALAVIEIGKPYGFRTAAGEPRGIYFDITTDIAKKANLDASVQLLPYKRMIHGMGDGTIDCAIFFTSQDRKNTYTQIGHIIQKQVIIVTNPFRHPDRRISLDSLESLEGSVVGKLRSAQYGDRFENNASIIKKEINDYELALQMLANGSIDAFIGAKDNIEQFFDHKNHYLLVNTHESWLQCSKHSPRITPAILQQLTQGLEALHQSNRILETHRAFINNFSPPRKSPLPFK